MKRPAKVVFDEWLTLMEAAFNRLSSKEFRELEEKIKHEIAFHRKRKRNGKPERNS